MGATLTANNGLSNFFLYLKYLCGKWVRSKERLALCEPDLEGSESPIKHQLLLAFYTLLKASDNNAPVPIFRDPWANYCPVPFAPFESVSLFE